MKKSNLMAVDLAKNTLQVRLLNEDDQVVSNKSIRVGGFSKSLWPLKTIVMS
jgi:hypothetical protein